MGNFISSHNLSQSGDENKTSNVCPVQFHHVYGGNVFLFKEKTVAYRNPETSNGAITFTNRPIVPLEKVVVKIRKTARRKGGLLRIGFTINDPESMKSRVPFPSCSDVKLISGNWVEELPWSANRAGTILSFHFDKKGDIYYNVDGGADKFLLGGVFISDKMWGIIDIYGNTVGIEFVRPDSSESVEDDEPRLNLVFHKMHGSCVELNNNRLIATRKEYSTHFPYVFSDRPLKFNETIIVLVLSVNKHISFDSSLEYGVTACDPANILSENLPQRVDDLLDWPDYWLPRVDSNHYENRDIIMYNMNPDGKFNVIKNGSITSSVFHVDTSQPLWLFLKLSGSVRKICLLGSSANKYSDIMKKFHHLTVSDPREEDIAVAAFSNAWIKKVIPPSKDTHLGECVICCEKPIDCALNPCGHMCMCFGCSKKLNKQECPICRKIITSVIKVYI